jgi:hypothetical protein
MKPYRGSRGTAPFIRNLGTIRRWKVSFTRRLLYRQREREREKTSVPTEPVGAVHCAFLGDNWEAYVSYALCTLGVANHIVHSRKAERRCQVSNLVTANFRFFDTTRTYMAIVSIEKQYGAKSFRYWQWLSWSRHCPALTESDGYLPYPQPTNSPPNELH